MTISRRFAVSLALGLFTPYLGRPEVDTLLISLLFHKRFWMIAPGSGVMYALFLVSWLVGSLIVFAVLTLYDRIRRSR